MKLVDPGVEAYKPKKGKPNVIMFVGLQVRRSTDILDQKLLSSGFWENHHLHKTCLPLQEEELEVMSGLCRYLQVNSSSVLGEIKRINRHNQGWCLRSVETECYQSWHSFLWKVRLLP